MQDENELLYLQTVQISHGYSHGVGSHPTGPQIDFLSKLASHGYIVLFTATMIQGLKQGGFLCVARDQRSYDKIYRPVFPERADRMVEWVKAVARPCWQWV